MKFWIFMFFTTLIMPISLLLMWYICPKYKKRNSANGYRTSRSMQNDDTWKFAQEECSKVSLKLFFPTLLLAVVAMLFGIHRGVDFIGWVGFGVTMIQMISFVVIIYLTEQALKKNFDENGCRK